MTSIGANKMLILYTPDVIQTITEKKTNTRLQDGCDIAKLEEDGPETLTV